MKLSVMICDDLEQVRTQLARMVQHYGRERGLPLAISLTASGEELLARWRPGAWDVIFLDIYMGAVSGVEAARRIRERDQKCALIFATTSQEHGALGYQLKVSDYLLKPFGQKEVDSALDWLLRKQSRSLRLMTIRSEWETVQVRVRDIRYIEIQKHTAMIHMDTRVIPTRVGLDALEAEIGDSAFFRCHRSFLVNLGHAVEIKGRDFRMDDGSRVPVSAQNMAGAKQALIEWLLEENWGK